MNLYEYASSNPVRYADPDGLTISETPDNMFVHEDESAKSSANLFDQLDELRKAGKLPEKLDKQFKEKRAQYQAAKTFVDNLKSLKGKKCPTLKVFYVSAEPVVGFASHAARGNEKCTVSWLIGHTVSEDLVAKDAAAVRGVLGQQNVPEEWNGAHPFAPV